MKKGATALLAILCCMAFSGCTGGGQGTVTASSAVSSRAASQTISSAKSIALTEKDVRSLMKENLNCVKNIFGGNGLPVQGKAIQANIFQVDAKKYADYAAFETYIRSIYCKTEAETLLRDYPYAGDPEYMEIDGKLCLNKDKVHPKGYYVDWTDYRVQILTGSDTARGFQLTAKIEEPAKKPQKKDYTVKARAVRENGRWLLEKMLR